MIYHFYQKSLLWWIDNDDEEDDGIGNQKSKLTKKMCNKTKT